MIDNDVRKTMVVMVSRIMVENPEKFYIRYMDDLMSDDDCIYMVSIKAIKKET